jgi:hypothetical protein
VDGDAVVAGPPADTVEGETREFRATSPLVAALTTKNQPSRPEQGGGTSLDGHGD